MITPSVIFDLDGTLINPYLGIAQAYRRVAREFHLDDISDDTMRRLIGPQLRDALRNNLGLSEGLIEDAVKAFRRYYDGLYAMNFSTVTGMEDALIEMEALGFSLVVVTNKPQAVAEAMLHECSWVDYFRFVIGPTPEVGDRSKSAMVADAATRLRRETGRLVVAGDRADDAIAARENGARSIGVMWGFGTREELLGAEVDALVGTPADLRPAIERLCGEPGQA